MELSTALDEHSQPNLSATGDLLCELTTATPANPDDVERVKGKWGEDLNTAFQYEKYMGNHAVVGDWASSALRYEWQDGFETDGIGPRDENLEKQLFGDDGEGNMGINFDK
jgi:hypothetical protein